MQLLEILGVLATVAAAFLAAGAIRQAGRAGEHWTSSAANADSISS